MFGFFRKSPNASVIERLHGEIMAAARHPALFRDYGIPDSFDGRFEALAAIATVPVRRLATLPVPGPELAQGLTDAVFAGFDDALRQMGVSDTGVPKRMKKLAEAWLGRRQAYAAALDAGDGAALAQALARNLYAGVSPAEAADVSRMARYIRALEESHARLTLNQFVKGPLALLDPIQIS